MSQNTRHHSLFDRLIIQMDHALQTVFAINTSTRSTRTSPAANIPEPTLTENQRQQVASLMRINHVGEVCAQALYQGQALTARNTVNKIKLEHAAAEEQDHLAWCAERIQQLGGRVSYLNPFWYSASFMIGAIAGLAGDAISLGFLAETEHQVEQHLSGHLQKLPLADKKSQRILEQMRLDESQHAVTAEQAGAVSLPVFIKTLMRCLSKVMTTVAHRI